MTEPEPFTDSQGRWWVVLPGAGPDRPSREELLSFARPRPPSPFERRVLSERRQLLMARRGSEAEIARIDALLAIEPPDAGDDVFLSDRNMESET